MNDNLTISDFLNDVLQDWEASRDEFPNNTYPRDQWPIPYFGNPTKAIVATVGVNPSSLEFANARKWNLVKQKAEWQFRLEHYFDGVFAPDDWFDPWRVGLAELGTSYEAGTAAHFDVSYRSTTAMLNNEATDANEFRCMVEKDVKWLFCLLSRCPKLRGLLVFGPIVRANGLKDSLAGFVRRSAPRHGFSVLPHGGLRVAAPGETGRSFFLHEVCASGHGTLTEQVVENLRLHRPVLCGRIEAGA